MEKDSPAAPADYPQMEVTPRPVPERIMVVDDSASARIMVESILQDAGFRTFGVASGKAALAHLLDFEPDLIVLDILMPDMDGLETCRRIREMEHGSRVPVLFLTGDERTQTQSQAIAAGGDDLIYKLSLKRELAIRVRSLLRIRKLQTALEHESKSLRELKESQEGLFRFLIHDLKSPLQAVLLNSQLAAGDPDLSPACLRRVEGIRNSAALMEHMVQDILVVFHQGQLVVAIEALQLRRALEGWIEELDQYLAQRHARVVNAVDANLYVMADPHLLRRCLINLLDNALKYGPYGNEIQITAIEEGEACTICMSDQGPGVPPEMRDHIFDPFARLGEDVSLARISSGLGLAFCREVAIAHGGRIWVEDGQPSGAAFCLSLPVGSGERFGLKFPEVE